MQDAYLPVHKPGADHAAKEYGLIGLCFGKQQPCRVDTILVHVGLSKYQIEQLLCTNEDLIFIDKVFQLGAGV